MSENAETSQVVKLLSDGEISEIQICRPKALNALNSEVLQSLTRYVRQLEKKGETKVLFLSGEGGRAFVAGADISEMMDLSPEAATAYVQTGQETMRVIERAAFPVIAVVDGYALGGGLELALSCDLIMATEKSQVGQPEVNLGILPGFGGTQRLLQRCSIGVVRRLVYSGERVDATEAQTLGIVDWVVANEELGEAKDTVAKNILSKGPLAIQASKRVIREAAETQLLSGLTREVEAFLELFATEDRLEGMKAFSEKRAANFKGC